MKPFMLRHNHEWLPKKLKYNTPYWLVIPAVAHEGFEFIVKPNSKTVIFADSKGKTIYSTKKLRKLFKEGNFQGCLEVEELLYQ